MFEKINSFLLRQKREMMAMDESEGLRDRERNGRDFEADVMNENGQPTGKKIGMREMLYNNTINYLINQGLQGVLKEEWMVLNQPGVMNETTLSTAIATFTTSLLPAVRRIYAKLIAMDLVSVQPLNGPSGYIYYLDHSFANTLGGATTGQRLDQYRYSAYAAGSEQGTIRAINYGLTSKLVSSVIKKLKATWTIESEQDLQSQWKLNLEAELMPEVTEEIIREWDQLIIAALEAGAGAGNINWNTTGYRSGDTTSTAQRDYRETIFESIIDADTLIYNEKYVHPDWILMDGTTFARIRKLNNFVADPKAVDQGADIQRRYEGVLSSQYKVYVDPWFTANKMLLGIGARGWKYAVGYFAPYIPLFTSEKYIINDDFTQFARGAMSRAAYGVLPEAATGAGSTTNNGLSTVTLTTS